MAILLSNGNKICLFVQSYYSEFNENALELNLETKTNLKNLNESDLADLTDRLSINFLCDNENYVYELKPRQTALKHFDVDNKISTLKLISFLKELYNRNILPEYALEFCFENFKEILDDLFIKINKSPEDATLIAIKNTGNVQLKSAKNGVEIDKNCLINNIYYNLVNNISNVEVPCLTLYPSVKNEDVNNQKFLRGHFYTTYSSSTAERKHNIEKALAVFDGLRIMPNEVLSFNNTTGVRSEANGYKGAKIIANGKFEDGVGGGVCQASTTLYNACLVSGLQIEEVNQHSLKVGYIAPSFDAMVNYGSSDLKIKNSTNLPITIATKCDGNRCEVFIYGEQNPYKIVRRSEQIKEIEPKEDIIVSIEDYKGNIDITDGEEKYANYPKKGLVSEGYLDYYQNDCLVATKKIRKNTYNASQGIKVVGKAKEVSLDVENIDDNS